MNEEAEDKTRGQQCPAWCIADHDAQQHTDDAWHESTSEVLPLVELQSVQGDDGRVFLVVGLEIEIGLERRVDGGETFVHIGANDQGRGGYRVSAESGWRLARALRTALQLECR